MVHLAITDAPSDAWQQVSVQVLSASLIAQGSTTPMQVWTATPGNASSGMLNLVDLSSVASLLGTVQVQAGTYTTLQLTINTDPSTMTLVDASGNTIPAADISVQGSGTLNVALTFSLVVTASGTTTLQADFDLADPLSIVEETLGSSVSVVLDLQVKPKPLPAQAGNLQFARKPGQVTATTASGFTLTDAGGASFTYVTDGNTLYRDADTHSAGSASGLTSGEYALVDSNLDSDGSLYARRVWYAATATALPRDTPEGLVLGVDATAGTFSVVAQAPGSSTSQPTWAPQTVTVTASTAWTFKGSVAMGSGTSYLADIWRGCRVDVQLDSSGTTATAVNVEAAYDEGIISAASASSLTFGAPGGITPPPPTPTPGGAGPNPPPNSPPPSANLAPRSYTYYASSTDPTLDFSWWYFGLPSGVDSSAADLVTVVNAGLTTGLPVNAMVHLYWDTTNNTWDIYELILQPEHLNTAEITAAYVDGGSGSGTMGITCLNPLNNFSTTPGTAPTPLTITLDYQGDLQTVVSSTTWADNIITTDFPVPSSSWASLLVPPASPTGSGVDLWVRPVIDGSGMDWHAYSVAAFTGKVPARPAITSFTANPTAISSGASSDLTAVFSNGTGVINPGNLAVTSGTPVSVSPTATTVFTLTVTAPNGCMVSQSTVVKVGGTNLAPAIGSFQAMPPAIPGGATASLVAFFRGGTGVITPDNLSISPGIPVPVTPTATTTYTLTVTGASGTTPATQTATVTVKAPPPAPAITSFAASPTSITAGATATLTAVYSGGMGVITPGFLPAPPNGVAITVQPRITTTYTLTVRNPAGQQTTLTATVTVTPASGNAGANP
jgi:hypothetical protein